RYRDNLATGVPSVWIVLTPSEGAWPYALSAVTADPAEGEAFTEAGANLVEAVPMPEVLQQAIENFIVEHHVETEFVSASGAAPILRLLRGVTTKVGTNERRAVPGALGASQARGEGRSRRTCAGRGG